MAASGQQIVDRHARAGRARHSDLLARERDRPPAIPEVEPRLGHGTWLAVHLELTMHQVDDPVLGYAGRRAQARLRVAVEAQRSLRYFDHQQRRSRMRIREVARAARYYRHVWLRLG